MFRKRFPMQRVVYASRAKKTSLNWNGNAPFGAALPLRISVFYLRRNNGTATSPNRDGKMQTQRNHNIGTYSYSASLLPISITTRKDTHFLCFVIVSNIPYWVSERTGAQMFVNFNLNRNNAPVVIINAWHPHRTAIRLFAQSVRPNSLHAARNMRYWIQNFKFTLPFVLSRARRPGN